VLVILAVLGYLLLVLVALILVLVLVVAFAPVRFSASGQVTLELVGEEPGLTGAFWLAALDPDLDWEDVADQDPSDAQEINIEVTGSGQAVLLWGLLAVSSDGVRFLGRRLGSRSGSGGQSRGESQAHPRARARVNRRSTADKAGGTGDRGKAETKVGRRYVSIRRLWPVVRHALARLWSALGLRVSLYLTLGLEDPVTTGLVAGLVPALLEPTIWSTNSRRPGSVAYRMQPVFDREIVATDFTLTGHTTPARLVWPMVRMAFTPEVRRLWRGQLLRRRKSSRPEYVIHW